MPQTTMTLGQFHAYLNHRETRSAKILFERMDMSEINELVAINGHLDGEVGRLIHLQLEPLRNDPAYISIIEGNFAKSPSIKERLSRWLTKVLISEQK